METTKIQLSIEEMELLKNSEWILTKNRVIEKMIIGLGSLAGEMQQKVKEHNHWLYPEVVQLAPKISRGEKYRGLPYLMLDYPRVFDKENIMAVRTLFWWGNFCSITLHLKGTYQALMCSKVLAAVSNPDGENLYVSVSGNEWNHDLNSDDYQCVPNLDINHLQKSMHRADFVKLAGKVEFDQWEPMKDKLLKYFGVFLKPEGF